MSTRSSTVRFPRLRAVVVSGESMTPALQPGDCLLVRVGARVAIGDVVVARHPGVPDLLLVKRIARRNDAGWWLLSDNAAAGLDDSRAFGAVRDEGIIGKVLLRYYPWRTEDGRSRLINRRPTRRGSQRPASSSRPASAPKR